MKTQVLDANQIDIAAAILKNGGVVGIPTETVYGLAADALNGAAVAKIFEAKGRPMDNPLIVHIADFADIRRFGLVEEIPERHGSHPFPESSGGAGDHQSGKHTAGGAVGEPLRLTQPHHGAACAQ